MKNNKRVLLLFAHPSQHRSEINQPMFQLAQAQSGVTCVDLYAEYPTLKIDVEKEQQRLIEHDIIIFQFPFYWYSTPAILKEWQDLVLEHGFAYGSEGTALQGKLFLCALSAGGKEKAYHPEGMNHYTLRDLLHPLEQTARLTGMHFLAPFALFQSRAAVEQQRLTHHLEDWKVLLQALVEDRIDTQKALTMQQINDELHLVLISESQYSKRETLE